MDELVSNLLDTLSAGQHPSGVLYTDFWRRQWAELWARGNREQIRDWLENTLLLQLGEERGPELLAAAERHGFKLRPPEVWPARG